MTDKPKDNVFRLQPIELIQDDQEDIKISLMEALEDVDYLTRQEVKVLVDKIQTKVKKDSGRYVDDLDTYLPQTILTSSIALVVEGYTAKQAILKACELHSEEDKALLYWGVRNRKHYYKMIQNSVKANKALLQSIGIDPVLLYEFTEPARLLNHIRKYSKVIEDKNNQIEQLKRQLAELQGQLKPLSNDDKKQIAIELYTNGGMTQQQIANRLDISKRTVIRWLQS